jgi:benzylsuccinate CoA-transferase BbsF subunit
MRLRNEAVVAVDGDFQPYLGTAFLPRTVPVLGGWTSSKPRGYSPPAVARDERHGSSIDPPQSEAGERQPADRTQAVPASRTPPKGYGNASRHDGPLSRFRICDLSGQLAGAGATRVLAAFGAQVIRVEDPATRGLWDIVRQLPPCIDDDRTGEGGSGFINHNIEKLGITLDLRTDRGKELLRSLVRVSDAVTENFAAGVMDRLGFGYDALRAIRPDIVYVSNSGFGATGPYRQFKSWGPIAQAMSGLTWSSGLPDREPAGWGFSYMDHTGGYVMAIALLAALWHRLRSGEGQWVDVACVEAGVSLNGPTLLDVTVNGRRLRRRGQPSSNRNAAPAMVPHGIYPCAGEDAWVAVACRHDADWRALADLVAAPWADRRWSLADRLAVEDTLDADIQRWTRGHRRDTLVAAIRRSGVPCAPVARPPERCDRDEDNAAWGLWPEVVHSRHGRLRVEGLPVHLSASDWFVARGGPLLGEDNERVLTEVLGLSDGEIADLRDSGVISP